MADVSIRSGDLVNVSFGTLGTITTTVNQASLPFYKISPYTTFQAVVSSTALGALTGTIAFQCSNDVWTGVGFALNTLVTTSGSAVVTSPLNQFAGGSEQLNDLFNPAVSVGMLVVGPGIPAGAYVSAVTNNGSITLSANATATTVQGGVSLRFFATNWCATVLGTITLSGTTSATAPSLSDGFTTVAPWKFSRAVVSNITGTGATVSVIAGV